MNTPTIAENSKVEHKQQKAFLREQPFPMNGKYNKRSFVRKTGSMSSGLWIYVMSVKDASPVRENRKYMSFARIRLFSPGEAGLKKKLPTPNMTDKKYFHHGTRKEWENNIVQSFSVNLSKTNKILEYFWSWYSLPTEKNRNRSDQKAVPFFYPTKRNGFLAQIESTPFHIQKGQVNSVVWIFNHTRKLKLFSSQNVSPSAIKNVYFAGGKEL